MRGSRRTVVIAIVGLANDDVSILSLFFSLRGGRGPGFSLVFIAASWYHRYLGME